MYRTTEWIPFFQKTDKRNSKLIISILCLIQLLVLLVATDTTSAINEAFILKISLEEQYDSSKALDDSSKTIERSTTISPGLLLDIESLKSRINLNYTAGFSFAQNEYLRENSILHQGICNWEHQLNRYLTLTMYDNFSRSRDRILISDGQIEKVFSEREISDRNNGEVSVFYQFGSQDSVEFGYHNNYEESKAINTQNGNIHTVFLNVDTRVTPKTGINAISSITRGIYKKTGTIENKDSLDFIDYETGLTINYSLSPIKTIYTKYTLLGKDFDDPGVTTPFWFYTGVLGLRMALSPLSEFHAEGGYCVQDFTNGTKRGSSTFDIGLSTRRKRYSIDFEGISRFDQDYFSSDNMDFFKIHKLSGTFNYLLSNNIQMSILASYRWEDFWGTDNINNYKNESQVSASFNYQLSTNLHIVTSGNYRWRKYRGGDYPIDKKDRVWLISSDISYTLRRWLTFSLAGSHSEQSSTDTAFIIREGRIMLRITASHPVLLKR